MFLSYICKYFWFISFIYVAHSFNKNLMIHIYAVLADCIIIVTQF